VLGRAVRAGAHLVNTRAWHPGCGQPGAALSAQGRALRRAREALRFGQLKSDITAVACHSTAKGQPALRLKPRVAAARGRAGRRRRRLPPARRQRFRAARACLHTTPRQSTGYPSRGRGSSSGQLRRSRGSVLGVPLSLGAASLQGQPWSSSTGEGGWCGMGACAEGEGCWMCGAGDGAGEGVGAASSECEWGSALTVDEAAPEMASEISRRENWC